MLWGRIILLKNCQPTFLLFFLLDFWLLLHCSPVYSSVRGKKKTGKTLAKVGFLYNLILLCIGIMTLVCKYAVIQGSCGKTKQALLRKVLFVLFLMKVWSALFPAFPQGMTHLLTLVSITTSKEETKVSRT